MPFAQENGICKHIVWCENEVAYDEALAERAQEYEEARYELAL